MELGLAFGDDGFAGFEAGKDFGPAVVLKSGFDFAGGGHAVAGDEDDGAAAADEDGRGGHAEAFAGFSNQGMLTGNTGSCQRRASHAL